MIVPKSAKQTMLIIPNTALDRMIDAALVNEDKRGNIVRILNFNKQAADAFHAINPKWSFALAKWMKEGLEEWGGPGLTNSIINRLATGHVKTYYGIPLSDEDQYQARMAISDLVLLNFLKEHPNQFRNIKDLHFREAKKYVRNKK